ncbi:MAG: CsiV family protein [Porticoccaceae bacterium]|nr:CsiV family protein [Porticoccaceae bacterium]
MFFSSHKAPLSRFLLVAMVPFFTLSNNLIAEQQTQETDPSAENWYQVEVILFDQKTITGSETAPQDFQISFPENWLDLTNSYPNIGIMRRPILDPSSTASIIEPEQKNFSKRLSILLGTGQYYLQYYNHGSTLIPEASIPYQNNDNVEVAKVGSLDPDPLESLETPEVDRQQIDTSAIEFKPVYEQPFQKLNKKLRDLNDTARALNRRKYKVRFHQAWRFQIDSKEQSPWVLVKTQQEQANRQIIEGTLRFYKSRYLHFESDLWRINFSPSENLEIVLPAIPQKNLNPEEESLLKALQFSRKFALLVPSLDDHGTNADSGPESLLEALEGYNLNALTPLLDSPRDTTAQPLATVDTNQYPIEAIWPIKQSKRIQTDEVYYIDHPYMGALVTIKSYSPEPINQQPNMTFPTSSDKLTNNP